MVCTSSRVHLTVALVVLALAAQLCAWCAPVRAEMIDGVVAVVDDTVIMYSDVQKKIRELGGPENNPAAVREVLKVMVEDAVVQKVYRQMGMKPVDPRHAEQVAQEMGVDTASAGIVIMKSTLMDLMVKSRVVITEAMIAEAYAADPRYAGSESLHLKQILIRGDTARASVAREEIGAGKPFDEVARAYSDVLVAGSPDIGWVALKDLATEAHEKLHQARPGDVVGPVAVQDAILIYQVIDRGATGGTPLDEVRDEIVESLQEKFRNEAFEHWFRMIMQEHFIGIYL
ncbi:MAG TPA: peptidyl-prolyl cis-trans isomerase [Deltaproteobacteria bacterium]|nr:peptidyl-prolyl cis-trans isomerase [Deltaproteobacteria bacterium]HQI82666.1 peptidyl-prolyl cis-trans isomerase [Deltaproteobacteria bacterium]